MRIVNTSVIEVRDEFITSASDNDDAPESPILFLSIQKWKKSFNEIVENKFTPKFNSVRDEFIPSADDK